MVKAAHQELGNFATMELGTHVGILQTAILLNAAECFQRSAATDMKNLSAYQKAAQSIIYNLSGIASGDSSACTMYDLKNNATFKDLEIQVQV
tara:strand:+ start:6031 stop:6309 length:279 start_codon:yes stop_codon:yes gene_type:complete